MMNEITVEAPLDRKALTGKELAYFLASWWRVSAYDGSTIAYVPDKVTADFLAAILNSKMGRHIK